jgi:small subunit ribosomal protein S1
VSQFEQMLDEYEYDRPRRGQIVQGEVIKVFDDMILVDIGAKRDAIVPRRDLDRLDEGMREDIQKGDQVPVYVFRTGVGDDELLVSLDKGLLQDDWDRAEEYKDSGEVIELPVVGYNKGGLLVEFGRLQGFVPNSHVTAIRRGTSQRQMENDKPEMIGSELAVKALEVDQKQNRLVFSEREAQRELRERRLEEIKEGQIVIGRVVNIVKFGAFVDLGGIDGMIHVSELSWNRVEDPADVLSPDDEIEVKVLDVDPERERVSLSRKATLPSPWDEVRIHYQDGDLVEGTVVNIKDYGAFVRLPEGVDGLVHVSELGFVESGNPKDMVRVGDSILTRILGIEPEKERISLSMRRVTYDEQIGWMVDHMEEKEVAPGVTPIQAAMFDAMQDAKEEPEASQQAEPDVTPEAKEEPVAAGALEIEEPEAEQDVDTEEPNVAEALEATESEPKQEIEAEEADATQDVEEEKTSA